MTTSPVPSHPAPPTAGPSRVLRQPLALSVAEKPPFTSSSSSTEPRPLLSEAAALRAAAKRKVQLEKRVDRYMDKLMEETVDRATFKKNVSYLQPAQYREVNHERHLNSLCSYPACPNSPLAPYRSQRRFVVSARDRTITEREGNAEEGFCSKVCRARSAWVERGLKEEAVWLRSRGVGEVELLEELEEKGEVVVDPKGMRMGSAPAPMPSPSAVLPASAPISKSSPAVTDGAATKPNPAKSIATTATPIPAKDLDSIAPSKPEFRPAPPAKPSLSAATPITDILASLTIHERPTPSSPPVAPSLSPSHPAPSFPPPEPIHPSTTTIHTTTSTLLGPAESTPSPTRRPQGPSASSLLPVSGSTSKLATALVAASKKMAAQQVSLGQAHARVDDGLDLESDGSESEEEWAKEMGWGQGDDEVDALFEQARAARELE